LLWPVCPERSSSPACRDVVRKKELPALEPGAMAYMMSKQGRLGDAVGHLAPASDVLFCEVGRG